MLNDLPQFRATQSPASTVANTNSSSSAMDLRGLGVTRTLTLLNNRRFTGSSDLNTVPQGLVKRVEIVTGGASGIGLAMADAFADKGMRLVIADVNKAALDTTEAHFKARGTDVLTMLLDVTDRAACLALPAAETRLATMQKMADELNAALAPGRNDLKASASIDLVAASLKASGLPMTLTPTGTSQLTIQGNVVFDDWINWLAGLAAQGWRVERAQIQRDGPGTGSVPSGSVKVEATLAAAGA